MTGVRTMFAPGGAATGLGRVRVSGDPLNEIAFACRSGGLV